jgi:hypothetical protein
VRNLHVKCHATYPKTFIGSRCIFSNKYICDFFSPKMFFRQCKNIIESERSSDEEVVSFTKTVSSSLDNEDAYEIGYLEEMLEESAIEEEDELTNTVDSLNNIQWNRFSSK